MGCQEKITQLPKELIEQIQEYVDGKVIYIPKKQENKKFWGENTDTRKQLASKNRQISLGFAHQLYMKSISTFQRSLTCAMASMAHVSFKCGFPLHKAML